MQIYHSDECSCKHNDKAKYNRWTRCEVAQRLLRAWMNDIFNINKRNQYFNHYKKEQ